MSPATRRTVRRLLYERGALPVRDVARWLSHDIESVTSELESLVTAGVLRRLRPDELYARAWHWRTFAVALA